MTCRPTLVAGADRCVTAGAVVRVTSVTLGLHQLLSSLACSVLSTGEELSKVQVTCISSSIDTIIVSMMG